jgi:hypothetical protein
METAYTLFSKSSLGISAGKRAGAHPRRNILCVARLPRIAVPGDFAVDRCFGRKSALFNAFTSYLLGFPDRTR